MHAVAPVAGKVLVAAVARQRHRDVFAGQLADLVGGDRRAVGVRLVVDAGELVDEVEVVAGHVIDEMTRLVAIGHLLGKARLVEGRIVERDRAGVDRLAGDARHGRDHGAGVHAARQERPERHLGDHAQADRFLEAAVQFLAGFLERDRARQREAHVPVLDRLGHGLAALHGQPVAGRQLLRAGEDRARLGHVAEREVLLDRAGVDLAAEAGVHQQRLELGAEQQRAVGQHA